MTMDSAGTRKFRKPDSPVEARINVTWIAAHLSVVRSDRAGGHRVDTQVLRDPKEFELAVERAVAAALADGYVEELPGQEEQAQVSAAVARIVAQRVTAYVPRLVFGDDSLEASKLGGTPWLPSGETWPLCGRCSLPMKFVLQLSRDECPEEMRWPFRAGLLQLYLCQEGLPGESGGCQGNGGSEPFAPSTLVRHVDPTPPAMALTTGCVPDGALDRLRAYRKSKGDDDFGRLLASMVAEGAKARPDATSAGTSGAELLATLLGGAPRRIAGWDGHADYPESESASLAVESLLEERKATCLPGDKLGGFPLWVQDPEVVECDACDEAMKSEFQLWSGEKNGIGLGDLGVGWILACKTCGKATFTWQSG